MPAPAVDPATPARRRRLATMVLALALTGTGCAGMDDTTRRTAAGAGIGATGGALIGSITGDAGWGALIGAGVGAAGGYFHDRNRRQKEAAYVRGVQDGRRARP